MNFPVTLQSVLSKIKVPKVAHIPNRLWNKHAHSFAAEVLEPSCLLNIICVFVRTQQECWGPCPL